MCQVRKSLMQQVAGVSLVLAGAVVVATGHEFLNSE